MDEILRVDFFRLRPLLPAVDMGFYPISCRDDAKEPVLYRLSTPWSPVPMSLKNCRPWIPSPRVLTGLVGSQLTDSQAADRICCTDVGGVDVVVVVVVVVGGWSV